MFIATNTEKNDQKRKYAINVVLIRVSTTTLQKKLIHRSLFESLFNELLIMDHSVYSDYIPIKVHICTYENYRK